MGLRIQNNIAALNSYNNVNRTDKAVSGSLEKLSSGFRINKAADDAAGLVVSEGLRSQIGGMTVAARNAQDGINVAQSADGALGVTTNILQRMRDLAVQASSGGAQDANAQKAANLEFGKLKEELTRITNTTAFGGQKLLDGNYKGVFQVGANAGEQLKVNLTSAALTGVEPTATFRAAKADVVANPGGGAAKTLTITQNGVDATVTIAAGASAQAVADAVATSTNNAFTGALDNGGNLVITSASSDSPITAKVGTSDLTAAPTPTPAPSKAAIAGTDLATPSGADKIFTITMGTKTASFTVADGTSDVAAAIETGLASNPDFQVQKDAVSGELRITSKANSSTAISVTYGGATPTPVPGANTTTGVADPAPTAPVTGPTGFDAAGLGLSAINLVDGTTPTDISKNVAASQAAINAIDAALRGVGTARATIGASQNRFEYALSSLNVSIENITASESAIRDTDMAAEMTKFTKNQILSQAGTSMLAQANSSTQNILTLLRG
ncbi:flagellin [Kineococcus sp. LSe6-4]|uniref:Flagellin n=1 Tax=Kineococcus halophytocola TaxID=3234027 RepID=A0ABV4H7H5_9ACTN